MKEASSETNNTSEKKKKKSYKAPKLLEYGSVQDLTKLGGSGNADFFGPADNMGGGMGMN